MSSEVGKATERFENELRLLRHFTYVSTHSQTLPSLYLRHSSFSNPSVASPTVTVHSPTHPLLHLTSQLILQPFRCFTYCHSSFSNPSVASPTVTAHSPTLPLLHLRHDSFSNPSFASPKSQFILQSFIRLSYVTSSSLNSPGEPPMQFTQC